MKLWIIECSGKENSGLKIMEKANDIIANIIKNVLTALYQPF